MASRPSHPSPSVVDRLREAGCVYADDETALLVEAAQSAADLATMVDRRVDGEPLEHILGWADFCGTRIAVAPGVFVPRPRSELLARASIDAADPGSVVVDLCCGSGAIGVVVAHEVAYVDLHAVDVDPAATRCARRNLAAVGGQVYDGDLFAPLPTRLRGRVDVVVANAPYVPTRAIRLLPPEARRHEAPVALDGGTDGLDVLRRVVRAAPGWLAPAGTLLVEASDAQAAAVLALFNDAGLTPQVVTDEELDATVVLGSRERG